MGSTNDAIPMNRLMLIDGSSVLSSSFFGNAPMSYLKDGDTSKLMCTSNGEFTNGVYTMTRILLNLFNNFPSTHLGVAWDVNRNTFRRSLLESYKGNRDETKPELRAQFGLMQQVLEDMDVAQFKFEGFEADDILGTLSRRFESEIQVCILTKDRDALQLVSEGTRVWLNTSKAREYMDEVLQKDKAMYNVPEGFFEFTPITFAEIYDGLQPIQIIDMKALEGDTSDNIPGVRGVGPKAVQPLLKEFGTVENMYEQLKDLSENAPEYLKDLLKDMGITRSPLSHLMKESDTELVGERAAYLSKRLATIKTDIPALQSISLDSLRLNVNWDATRSVFERLEFGSLLKQVG